MSAVRVLLVDDHAVMRAGFRMILEAADGIEIVGEAATGAEAVAAASALRPDVVCMDVQMPDMDGIEATRRIVADPAIHPAVVIVTTFDRDDYLFEALAAGATGFLLKNAGPEELVSAVRVAAAGDALLAPEVTRRVIARFANQPSVAEPPSVEASPSPTPTSTTRRHAQGPTSAEPPPVAGPPPVAELVEASSSSASTTLRHAQGPTVELTDRESEVLGLVAQAMSNAEIATRLYIGEATVKTHVSNILQKLGARDRVAAVVYAHRHGLT